MKIFLQYEYKRIKDNCNIFVPLCGTSIDLDLQNDNLSLKKSFYFILLHSTDIFVLIKVVQSSVKIVLK